MRLPRPLPRGTRGVSKNFKTMTNKDIIINGPPTRHKVTSKPATLPTHTLMTCDELENTKKQKTMSNETLYDLRCYVSNCFNHRGYKCDGRPSTKADTTTLPAHDYGVRPHTQRRGRGGQRHRGHGVQITSWITPQNSTTMTSKDIQDYIEIDLGKTCVTIPRCSSKQHKKPHPNLNLTSGKSSALCLPTNQCLAHTATDSTPVTAEQSCDHFSFIYHA